jgi:pimeloyl-ACP methyl ester carboxylesterase
VIPETRYAKTSDGIHIAYQVLGDGPIDLVYVGPWVTHIEYRWELPQYASYLRRMASFSRLIMFDKRGFGMSDPVPADQLPNLETRMDDLRAVVDEVGSDRAVIYGASESGMLDLLFAATYPERTLALVVHGSYPSVRWEPDAPWGWREEEFAERLAAIERSWGTEEFVIRWAFPEMSQDPALLRWFTTYTRRGASPGAVIAAERMELELMCATSCRRSTFRLSSFTGSRTIRRRTGTWPSTSRAPSTSPCLVMSTSRTWETRTAS